MSVVSWCIYVNGSAIEKEWKKKKENKTTLTSKNRTSKSNNHWKELSANTEWHATDEQVFLLSFSLQFVFSALFLSTARPFSYIFFCFYVAHLQRWNLNADDYIPVPVVRWRKLKTELNMNDSVHSLFYVRNTNSLTILILCSFRSSKWNFGTLSHQFTLFALCTFSHYFTLPIFFFNWNVKINESNRIKSLHINYIM